MKEDMKKNILSCITNLIIKVTYAKFVRYFIESSAKPGGSTGTWSHNAVIFKDNLGKKLTRHDKSETHKDAMNSLTNLKIKDQFEKID